MERTSSRAVRVVFIIAAVDNKEFLQLLLDPLSLCNGLLYVVCCSPLAERGTSSRRFLVQEKLLRFRFVRYGDMVQNVCTMMYCLLGKQKVQ